MLSSSSSPIGTVSTPTPQNVVHLIAVYNHMAGTFPRKNLPRTLHEQVMVIVWESHGTSHGPAFARDWDHQNDVGGIAYLLVVGPTEILCEL